MMVVGFDCDVLSGIRLQKLGFFRTILAGLAISTKDFYKSSDGRELRKLRKGDY
jgi:hypothetical protein